MLIPTVRALMPPVLADYFGFTVSDTSYFFFGVTAMLPIACITS